MNLKPIESVQTSLERLVDKRKKYLLAFSSGGDSVFLLYQLSFYFKESLKEHIALVYINYHDSGLVKEEERIFFHYVSFFELSYFKKDVHYRKNYGNFEDWARRFRYHYFRKLVKDNHYEGLLTAHQKTDYIETYRLQLIRNNLPLHYGLSEINNYQGRKIIRPRLSISKKQLTARLEENKILFYDDITNYNRNKKRNKIRTEIKEEDRDKEIQEAEERNNTLSFLYLQFSQKKAPYSYAYYSSLSKEQKKRFCFYLLEKQLPKSSYSSGLGKKRYSFLLNPKPGVLKLTDTLNLYRYKEGFFLYSDLNQISYEYVFRQKKEYITPYFQIDLSDPSLFNRKELPVKIRNYHKGDQLGTDLKEKDVYLFLKKQGVPSFLIPIYPMFIQNEKIQCVPFFKDLKKNDIPFTMFIPCLFVRNEQI